MTNATTETWRLVNRGPRYVRATGKWDHSEVVIATGLTRLEADLLLTRRHNLTDVAEVEA